MSGGGIAPKYGTFKYGRLKYGSTSLTAIAGITHDVTLDQLGLMLASPHTRSDITSAVPRLSIGTDQRRHTDFSERDTWGQESWHHGRGELEIKDPVAFLDSDNVVTWIPNQATIMPAYTAVPLSAGGSDLNGYVSDQTDFQGNLYQLIYGEAPANNKLMLFNNTNSNFDTVTAGLDTVSGEPLDLHVFDTNMYVAQGESVNMRRFTGTVWSNNGYPARFLATFDSKMWRADNINELFHTTDPSADAGTVWTGPLEVGDAAYPIRGMLAGYDGALWVGKDDGIYTVRLNHDGSGYDITLAVGLGHIRSSRNGAAMIEFGGHLYVSVANTLMRYDGQTVQFMGPDRGAHETELLYETQTRFGNQPLVPYDVLPATYQSGVTGGIGKMAHDNNFLYVAVDNEGIGQSRVMLWGGTGWHVVRTSNDGARIRSVFYTSPLASTGVLNYPGLWWSESTGDVYYNQKWGRFTHNPLDDATLNYTTNTATITLGWFDGGLRDVDKSFFEVLVRAKNLTDGGNEISVEYQVDDFAVWYTLGTVVSTPEGTLRLPDDSTLGEPAINARRIRYRFTLARGAVATSTPIMQSWAHRFVVRPESRYGWQLTVTCYDNFTNHARQDERGRAQIIRNELYSKRDKKLPIAFADGTELDPLTNLHTNPSFELDTNADGLADGLTVVGTGITTDRSAQFKASGVLSQRVTFGSGAGEKGLQLYTFTGIQSGDVLFASAFTYVLSGDNVTLEIRYGGTVVGDGWTFREASSSDVDSSRFKRGYVYHEVTAAEATAAGGTFVVYLTRRAADGSGATMFYADAIEAIKSTTVDMPAANPDYIDGDQLRCHWNGTPHASTSTRQATYFVYITGLSEVFRYDEGKRDSVTRNSEITLSLREMR